MSEKQIEAAAWMDDGSYRAGSDGTSFRVVTAATKAAMPSASAVNFTTPLYTRAALQAVEPVKVKPLEWHKSHMPSWNDDWHTIGPFIYTIRCADENGWKWSHGGGFGYSPSPESCKAFAQADYELRILAAINQEQSS